MKNLIYLLAVLILSANIFAQENQTEKNLFKLGDYNFGGYIGTNLKYSQVFDDNSGFLDLKAAFVINHKYSVGFSLTGLYYDKSLDQLVENGTYHIYGSFAGLLLERHFVLSERFKLSLSINSGTGTAYYQYDKDYRENVEWYEEIIDRENFGFFEPGIELQTKISKHFWLGAVSSYRFTSPLKLKGQDEDVFRNLSAGISIKYGIF